ncbi:aminoacetone oxidase family FAD-binding enzyme [Pontiella sp. NLcol2]|uniref:Aminoacetone oxidase family FAD-binding enzyme n=1 Tax=Pontiella agarivorans TaxID=3038953 RepID=A0ABU5MX09_9BACT|nr:aminoacetone oxidase family FAD-binding enzyme [Pontiella agarivorans]
MGKFPGMEHFDVIVVGGGPAGMIAAGHAAEYGRNVLLLEKNPAPGKKLELSGGGRCNITNGEFDHREFLANYAEYAKFLFSPFSRFGAHDTFEFFENLGLPLYISEDRKRAFPKTDNAADVTRALRKYMAEYDVECRFSSAVKGLLIENGKVCGVQTRDGAIRSESIILATGGTAYPETGSTGEAFQWLEKIGHTIIKATPDIVPLRVKEQWVKELSGTALDPMRITFTAKDGTALFREGKILFTHFGISGPLILNSAHEVKKLLKQGPVAGAIDLFPKREINEIDRTVLAVFDDNKNKIIRNVTRLLVPAGMAKTLNANLPVELLEKKVNVVTQEERKQLARLMKNLPLTVTATMGYDWAVVCDGGIPLEEVDTRTMASRLHPNVFITGDMLNISRPSGGFSLQLCWTTGFVAGENA